MLRTEQLSAGACVTGLSPGPALHTCSSPGLGLGGSGRSPISSGGPQVSELPSSLPPASRQLPGGSRERLAKPVEGEAEVLGGV